MLLLKEIVSPDKYTGTVISCVLYSWPTSPVAHQHTGQCCRSKTADDKESSDMTPLLPRENCSLAHLAPLWPLLGFQKKPRPAKTDFYLWFLPSNSPKYRTNRFPIVFNHSKESSSILIVHTTIKNGGKLYYKNKCIFLKNFKNIYPITFEANECSFPQSTFSDFWAIVFFTSNEITFQWFFFSLFGKKRYSLVFN